MAQATQAQSTPSPFSPATLKLNPASVRQMDSLMMSRQRNSNIPSGDISLQGKNNVTRANPQRMPQSSPQNNLRKFPVATGNTNNSNPSRNPGGNNNLVCSVISGRDFLEHDSLFLYTGDASMLPDGNLIVSGEFGDYNIQPNINLGGYCMKTTTNGELIWGVLLDSADLRWDYMWLPYSLPLQNGDILLAGRARNPVLRNDDFVMVRLDGNGNLLWLKAYQSRYWTGGNGSADFLKIADLDEDPVTGDIYFTGSHWFGKTTVTKFSGANGAVTWSRTYKRYHTDTPFGLEMNGNTMTLFTLGYDNSNSQFINIINLTKSTGDTINTKSFKEIRTSYFEPGMYNTWRSRKTSNGHYLLGGPTTGYYEYPVYTGTRDLYHASVVELDENFNFVKSYGFKNRVESNGGNTKLSFFPDGSGVFTMMKYISGYTAETYISLFNYDTIYHNRRRTHINEGLPYEPPSLQLPDGGIINVKLMGDSTAQAGAGSHLDFYRAHTADTASNCMGRPDSSTNIWYRNFEPNYWNSSDSVTSNVFFESLPKTYTLHRFGSHREPGCVVESNCDSLDLSISQQMICLGSTAVLTIHRNAGCGSLVPLAFDNNALQLLTRINDSSYLFKFNNAGTFTINGSLQGCSIIRDSLQVTVLPAPGAVNLGRDSALCAGNTMVLHAGNLYASYQWQDGSTDSLFTVNAPGMYHVQVTDACGNTYKDTVAVNAAVFPFSIGADRVKCNSDTLSLSATPGFVNYQWRNNYQLSNTTGQTVLVSPLADTFYYASAEKWPGCVVRDTVHITVNRSPIIQLGADSSLCAGDSLLLNAGTGFTNYVWNTGAATAGITVSQPALYSVLATAANGCTSSDSFLLLPSKPLPVFSLGADTTLCNGQSLRLQVSLPQATCQWQDGTNSNVYTIGQPGLYTLAVTQQGCRSIDSIVISYKPSPVVQLGKDSLLCQGQSLLLDAGNPGALYRWQDGASTQQTLRSVAGIYRVTVDLNGCIAADTISLRFDPLPDFSLGPDRSLCASEQILLNPVMNTALAYLWQDGSTASSFMVTRAGTYFLTGSNHCGVYTDSIKVAEGLCKLLMPDAFTPNNDGINDIFRVKYLYPVKEFSFVIYNRYGQPVFETTDMSRGWDGTFKSAPQETGAYVWIIRLKDKDDKAEQQSGSVILLR
jgi:gliding motility-associated-like protein